MLFIQSCAHKQSSLSLQITCLICARHLLDLLLYVPCWTLMQCLNGFDWFNLYHVTFEFWVMYLTSHAHVSVHFYRLPDIYTNGFFCLVTDQVHKRYFWKENRRRHLGVPCLYLWNYQILHVGWVLCWAICFSSWIPFTHHGTLMGDRTDFSRMPRSKVHLQLLAMDWQCFFFWMKFWCRMEI